MESSSFIGLVNNAALLLALTLLYDMLVVQSRIEKSILYQIFTGFILSAIGIAIMLNPWNFGQGVLFDTRSVLLSVSGLFFGTIPVILAVLSTSFFRLFSGGSGAWTGVGVIVTSGCLGLGWRYFYRNSKENFSMGQLYLLGIVTHVAMLAWMLSLPWEIATGVLSKITLPVMLIYPLLTVILGKLMINRKKHKKAGDKRRIFFEMLQNSDHIAIFKDTSLRYVIVRKESGVKDTFVFRIFPSVFHSSIKLIHELIPQSLRLTFIPLFRAFNFKECLGMDDNRRQFSPRNRFFASSQVINTIPVKNDDIISISVD